MSGHKDFWCQGEGQEHEEEEESDSEPEAWESEKPFLHRNWRVIAQLFQDYESTTKPSDRIKTVYNSSFEHYDSLYISLLSTREYFEHQFEEDPWLLHFLKIFDDFAAEVQIYRDSLNTLKNRSAPSRMSVKLFESLVCLLLTPEQIEKLKSKMKTNMYTALDNISGVYDKGCSQ